MQIFSHTLALSFARLRMNAPMVQCISSLVALDFLTNVLLALGVRSAFIHASEEIGDFSKISKCLMISTGTLSGRGALAMSEAASIAQEKVLPWVLEAQGIGDSQFRDKTIFELLAFKPDVVRASVKDVMLMAGHFGFESKLIEKARTTEEQVEAARHLAREANCVVAMTGPTDIITNHADTLRITNGHSLMAKVAGMGTALSAVISAFLTVENDPLLAAAIAVGVYDIIGELAGADVEGPAAFRSAFIDRLYTVDANAAMRRLKIL
jgi:hydroxyethylthiazole kinase